MRFSVLASGSTGNALYIETEETRILIDAGLTGKHIQVLLTSQKCSLEKLDAIVVTHEHKDHIKGLGVLARRYKLPVYATPATWEVLPSLVGEIAHAQVRHFAPGQPFRIGDLDLEGFPVSHDAVDPVGFSIYHGDEKLSLAQDLGYVSQKVLHQLKDSHVLILEANYDVEMLRTGSYPWNIKRRILSDTGHLSNEAAGDALVKMLATLNSHQLPCIYLAHLSQENNMIDLAHVTVRNILAEAGVIVGGEVKLCETYPDRATPLRALRNI